MGHRHSTAFQKDLSKNPQTVLWKLCSYKKTGSGKVGGTKAGFTLKREIFALLCACLLVFTLKSQEVSLICQSKMGA